MAYNYSKLIGRIAEKGETRESLCEKIGISSMTFRGRLHGKSPFNQDEIAKIAEVLDIGTPEIPLYFFSE